MTNAAKWPTQERRECQTNFDCEDPVKEGCCGEILTKNDTSKDYQLCYEYTDIECTIPKDAENRPLGAYCTENP